MLGTCVGDVILMFLRGFAGTSGNFGLGIDLLEGGLALLKRKLTGNQCRARFAAASSEFSHHPRGPIKNWDGLGKIRSSFGDHHPGDQEASLHQDDQRI